MASTLSNAFQKRVADILPDGLDAIGLKIVCIYARKPPEYAVYRSLQRVLVHFADDLTKSDEQRTAIACLAPLRGEINGLIDGWRTAPDSKRELFIIPVSNGVKLRAKAERYDRRVADAMQLGLEGDVAGAKALLAQVKQDILDERIGWSRFEYLVMAFVAVFGVIALSEVAMWLGRIWPCSSSSGHFLCVDEAVKLWRAFAGGAVGAFFSIALGIRGRTILTDLYRTSNIMDAILRIVVGSISGVVLVSLALAKFVQLRLGAGETAGATPLEIFIISFVAGFAERLVPDLLARAGTATTGPNSAPPVPPAIPLPPPAAAPGAPGQLHPGATAAGAADSPLTEEPGDEASGPDVQVAPDEVTNDEELPAASGGVASSQEGA